MLGLTGATAAQTPSKRRGRLPKNGAADHPNGSPIRYEENCAPQNGEIPRPVDRKAHLAAVLTPRIKADADDVAS
jgi:hypothetical protein